MKSLYSIVIPSGDPSFFVYVDPRDFSGDNSGAEAMRRSLAHQRAWAYAAERGREGDLVCYRRVGKRQVWFFFDEGLNRLAGFAETDGVLDEAYYSDYPHPRNLSTYRKTYIIDYDPTDMVAEVCFMETLARIGDADVENSRVAAEMSLPLFPVSE